MDGLIDNLKVNPNCFAELYKASKTLPPGSATRPVNPKRTYSVLEDIFLPDRDSPYVPLEYLKFGVLFILTLSIGPIAALALKQEHIRKCNQVADRIQKWNVTDLNKNAENKNDTFHWIYKLSLDSVDKIETLFLAAVTALEQNQNQILSNVVNPETVTPLLDDLPGNTSLVAKAGAIFLQKHHESFQLLSFAQYLTLNKDRIDLTDTNLSGSDLTRVNLSNKGLTNVDVSKCKLHAAMLSGMSMSNMNFNEADLTRADIQNTTIANSTMNGVNIAGARFDCSDFENTTITLAFPDWNDPATVDHHFTAAGGSLLNTINSIDDKYKEQKINLMHQVINSLQNKDDTGGACYALINFFNTNLLYAEDEVINRFRYDFRAQAWSTTTTTSRTIATTTSTALATTSGTASIADVDLSFTSSTGSMVDLDSNSSNSSISLLTISRVNSHTGLYPPSFNKITDETT